MALRSPGTDDYTHVSDSPRRFLSKELHAMDCERKGTPLKKANGQDGDISGIVVDAVSVSVFLR